MDDERMEIMAEDEVLPQQPYRRYFDAPITLEEAEGCIEANLVTTARMYVATGYYLKRIRDDRLYEEGGYKNFEEYVRGKYGKDKGWASKCIRVSQQLSVDGDSPFLDSAYKDYSTYQLVELAYMTEEQRELASPEQTVKQLQEIRRPEKVVMSQPEEDPEQEPGADEQLPGQTDITDFPQFLPENMPTGAGDVQEDGLPEVFQMDVSQMLPGDVLLNEQQESEECCETAAEEGGAAAELDMDGCPPGIKSCIRQNWGTSAKDQHEGAKECAACWNNWMAHKDDTVELSAYGTAKREYPTDSLIATAGCEGGHDCFSCSMECGMRREERYCRMAPMGNPFPCTTMNVLENLKEEIGEQCQFINHGLACHRAGDGEANPCCKQCGNPSCGYRCGRAAGRFEQTEPLEEPGGSASGSTEIIDAESEEIPEETQEASDYDRRILLDMIRDEEETLKEMEDYWKENQPHTLMKHRMKLASYQMLLESHEQAGEEPVCVIQPELPQLKNNEQRAAFIDAYGAWPIWIDTKATGERYYRYELPGAALVVKVYYHKCFDYNAPASGRWEGRYHDDWGDQEYYLIEDGKHFRDCRRNRSTLIEYLKEIQKKG